MSRQQDVTRRVVVDLKKVEDRIPRNAAGDPAFEYLGALEDVPNGPTTILEVFTPIQICALVNRALYQMEYSRKVHRERSQEIRDREKPVKEMFKQMFPGTSWANATEEQIRAAVVAVVTQQKEGV